MSDDRYDVLDLGLRAPLEGLLKRATELQPGGGGATIFIAGQEGSGRTALLDSFVTTVSKGRSAPLVLSGTFESGEYVARNGLGERLKKFSGPAESVLTATGPLHPMVAAVSQLAAASKAARQLLESLAAKSSREHPLALLPDLLRRSARTEGPVVCVIDDADKSGQAWWADLILSLGRQVSVDLPLLLVFAIDHPEELGDEAIDGPPGSFAARQLVGEGLAEWQPLRSRTTTEVADWIGDADPAVPRRIVEITGGRGSWTAGLWKEWREEEVVCKHDGRWRFEDVDKPGGLAPVSHLLGRRLQKILGKENLALLADTQELLACAALEGRVFTADALALVLERDPEELIDFLDDNLSADGSQASGLVEEVSTLTVRDEKGVRHLRRYRFQAELDWLVSRQYGLPDENRRKQRALSLVEALRSLYGAASDQVALVVAELFELADERERARRARRKHNFAVDRETAFLRAGLAFGISEEASQAERNRGAEVLVASAHVLYNSGPWKEGLRFCERATQMTDMLPIESRALYYAAWFRFRLNDFSGARTYLERALAGAEAEGDRRGIADAFHQIANLDLAEERLQEAEEGYEEVLELRRALKDRKAQATVHEALGDVRRLAGDEVGARAEYEVALKIAEEEEDRRGWANTRLRVARVEFESGKHDRCREMLGEAIEIQREFGDRQNEMAALSVLSQSECAAGRFEQARAAALRGLELTRETGDPDKAALLQSLATAEAAFGRSERAMGAYRASIASAEKEGQPEGVLSGKKALGNLQLESGDWPGGRASYEDALEIAGAVESPTEEAGIRRALAELLYAEGRNAEARDALLRVASFLGELGEAEGEAEVHGRLGVIAWEAEDFEAADGHLTRALEVLPRFGNVEEEAIAGMCMAAIELVRGEVNRARERLQRTLTLQRELGDAEAEAECLRLLREIDD